MQEEFTSLGEALKERRIKRNLSLKEIENATSIRMCYLEAIEEGQFGKLISPIYAQGFIKKYAFFLDLDGEALIRENPNIIKFFKESVKSPTDFPLGIGSFEVRGTPGSEIKWLPNLLWVALSATLIIIGFFVARYFNIF